MFDSLCMKQAKGLLLEQKMLSCYELVENFVGCISDHVEDIAKQKYVSLHMHKKIVLFSSLLIHAQS